MASLVIEVEESGVVRVSMGGVVVGMIKRINIEYDEDLHPVPHTHVSFANLADVPMGPEKAQLKRTIQRYKEELQKHPLVRVSDYHDTLPQMPAVRPEEE
jgi:hypothetical protein